MIKAAITLYLRSADFDQVLQKYLHLPHPNIIKSFFGTMNTSGSVSDCQKKIANVFNKLSEKEKYCKVLADEIYLKPAVRYSRKRYHMFFT